MPGEWYALVGTRARILVRAEKMSCRRIDEHGGIILEEKFIQRLSSNGDFLPSQKVIVKARKSWDGVEALIFPVASVNLR
jgi:hypothetical protein